MHVDHIDDLRVFAQVVDSGTLAAAGRTLGLPPSIVTRRLARLERSLNVRLIRRTTRALSVTDEGHVFYKRCRTILTQLEAAEAEVKPDKQKVAGIVRAVLPSSTVVYGIMESLADLLEKYPKLSVQIRLSDQSATLHTGGWDVATHIGVPQDSTHIGRPLSRISPRLAATPEYLAHHGIPDTPLDLTNHQCIRFGADRNRDFWSVIDAQDETHRIPINGQIICEDIVTLYAAMRAGLGIGMLPKAALRRAKEDGSLVEVLADCQIEGQTLYALIPSGRHVLPPIRVFVDWLAGFMQNLDLDGNRY